MKARLIASLIVALLLVAIALPAMAAVEQSVGATVTVSEVLSITITDESPTGITFGSLAPGTTDNPDLTTIPLGATTSSVTVNVGAETNVTVKLGVKGTDFSGSFPVTNAEYSLTYAGAKIDLSTTYAEFATGLSAGETTKLWHWLDVPAGTTAGTYTSTFSYKAVKTTGSF